MEMKTRLPFLLMSLLLVALLAACGGSGGSGNVPNDAIATVDSTPISKTSFNSLMAVACARYKAQGQACPKVGTPTYTQLRDQAVTFLVQQDEFQTEAKKLGVTVTQKDIDNQVQQIKKTYYKGSEKQLEAALKKDDITLQQLEDYNLLPNLLNSRLQAKVTSDITVSDAAAQKYYTQNKTSFTTPKTREVQHILVNSKSLAEKIETKLKNGASFAALAKKYSKDTGSAAQGGKICVAHGGQAGACQQTVAPFDKAAFSLKTNEISLVHSVYGWHVIQPIAAVKPAHTQTFKEVKTQIQANLSSQQKQAAWQKWVTKMQSDFKSKVAYQTGYTPAATTTSTTTPATTTG
ncbi:MAG TPA: peptidyl-prolyl cis-trans isomerase [Gaiellaceae bacterium]|nr:peptidyl-prolyl cis-trans isomerase [Gaiellaceae bacterium]